MGETLDATAVNQGEAVFFDADEELILDGGFAPDLAEDELLESSRRTGEWMNFGFRIEGDRFYMTYPTKKFAGESADIKLMLAVGQASTLEQTDEEYHKYLLNVTNKGYPKERLLQPSAVRKLLRDLTESGYTQNGGPRYRLTAMGKQNLLKEAKGESTFVDRDEQSKCIEPQDSGTATLHAATDTNEGVALIKPLGVGYPATVPASLNQPGKWLPESHKANYKSARSCGYRALEVLAELELSNGVIESPVKAASSEIRERTGAEVTIDSYQKAIDKLKGSGLVAQEDKNSVTLTEHGRQAISLLKDYFWAFREAPTQYLRQGTSSKIIEYILEESGFRIDISDDSQVLPEASNWLMPPENDRAIYPYLADSLDASEETICRRIYELRATKHCVETIAASSNSGVETIVNIRVLKKGIELLKELQLKQRDEEGVLEDAEVEEVQEVIDACRYLAETLGDQQVLDGLDKRYKHRTLFEFSHEEFENEKSFAEILYNRLRGEFCDKPEVLAA